MEIQNYNYLCFTCYKYYKFKFLHGGDRKCTFVKPFMWQIIIVNAYRMATFITTHYR